MSSAHLDVQSAPPSFSHLTDAWTPFDQRAFARLEAVLSQIRRGTPVEEDAVIRVAWAYFVAGIKAQARLESDPAAPTCPTPSIPPPLESVPTPTSGYAPDARSERSTHDLVAALTPRRLEVLRLVARGLTNREIGHVLGISRYTVKSHMATLFESLDVTNRTEAAYALQQYEERNPPPSN